MTEKNAVIEYAKITNDDHGMLTIWIGLNYGGSDQGFGGYALYLPKSFKHHNKSDGYCGHFIWRVMEIADVSEWRNIIGKTVRVKSDHLHVYSIGHIIKDDWFCPEEDFK